MVNGLHLCSTFLTSFLPLKELYYIASRSPIHAHILTPKAVSTRQSDSQLVGSSECEVSCSCTPRHSSLEEPGIELATIRSEATFLYHLSYMPHLINSWTGLASQTV